MNGILQVVGAGTRARMKYGRPCMVATALWVVACGANAPPPMAPGSAADSSSPGPTANDPRGQRVMDACAASYGANKGDCNKFMKAVCANLGVAVPAGLDANAIVDLLADSGSGWRALPDGNGAQAKQAADEGKLVIAGLRGAEHGDHRSNGHVAVIVSGKLDVNGFPTGYWGSITPGMAQPNASIRKSWRQEDAVRVHYFTRSVP